MGFTVRKIIKQNDLMACLEGTDSNVGGNIARTTCQKNPSHWIVAGVEREE